MKKLIILLLILPTISIVFSQSLSRSSNTESRNTIVDYSQVDFFKDQKKLFCWNGPISSSKSHRGISNMPLMEYNDLAVGQCRIISYPKAGLSAWESIIKPIRDLEPQHQEVRKIAMDPQVQHQYNIYAFFVEAKNLVPFWDPGDPNAREPKFPCPVFVYKRTADKWLLLKKIDIKDSSDFAELKFDTVVGNKK
jgi:hypothetical protein